jgi:acetyltransferase-like isoleucine patch superfamily enzyme
VIEDANSPAYVTPGTPDPEDIARKLAANPNLKIPPAPQWTFNSEGRVESVVQEGMTSYRKARNYLAALFYNSFVTHIPIHAVRLGYLRLFGATIGRDSAIMRGTMVWDIEFLTVGDRTSIGFRCLLDCRGGVAIGDDVGIASDTHLVGLTHDVNHPDFIPIPVPIVIEDYVWIASRAMILQAHIHRGAIVAAHAVVNRDVAELDIVGGVPAKVVGKRNPDALKYSGKFKPPLS